MDLIKRDFKEVLELYLEAEKDVFETASEYDEAYFDGLKDTLRALGFLNLIKELSK